MTTFFQKIPNAFVICASTLLCSMVVLLQNAANYADRMEVEVAALAAEGSALMRKVSELTYARELNAAELAALSMLSQWAAPEATDAPTASDMAEAALPAEPQATAPAVAEEPVIVLQHEQEPVIIDVDTGAKLVIDVEVVESDVLALAAERELIPVGQSRWARDILAEAVAPSFVLHVAGGSKSQSRAGLRIPRVAEPSLAVQQPTEQEQKEPLTPPEGEPQPAAPEAAEAGALLAAGAEQPQLTEAPPMRYRIMMVGDSLMEDLGPRTHKAYLNRKGLDFVICAKFSTGLCRPEIFNWAAHLRTQVEKRPPDLVVFFIGANDGMPIREGRRLVGLGKDEWREAYMRKMDELVGIARGAGAQVIWVELPAIGGRYNRALFENQRAQREYCERTGTLTMQTDPLLSGEWGKFEHFGEFHGKQVRLRRKDLTHLTAEGNTKVLEHLQPMIESCMIDFYNNHPERHLSAEEVARIKKVPVVYTCKPTAPKKAATSKPQ